jgi:arabinofuranosyltransferase
MSTLQKPSHPRRAAGALFLLPPLLALAFGWWMLALRRYLLIDDAYISFRYAANFAHGHGLVWNAGVPVEGYTCLLWVLLLSAVAHTGVDLTWPAIFLSAAFGLGCLELLRRIARNARAPESSHWELVPGLLLASLPSFAHAMTSGMEETCFAFLCLLALHLLVLSRGRPALRAWCGVAFAAASLTRPEGPLVAATALAVEVTGLAGRRARVQELLLPALCVGSVVVAHTLFRLAYYGYPLPNTFYAKVIFGSVTLGRGVRHLAAFGMAGGWLLLFAYCSPRSAGPLWPWLVHGYALAVVYCCYLLVVGGDHPHWFRFYVPLLPLPLLGVSLRLRAWTRSPGRTWSGSDPLATLGCCALIALATYPFSEAAEPVVGRIDRSIEKVMVDVDRFFDAVPKDSFCAVAAIGYVGYRHLTLHILDVWGLTDTHIAHLRVAPAVKFGHDKEDQRYVASLKPDYIYVFAPLPTPALAGYDVCWPSDDPPAAVYRRALPLLATDTRLGVPAARARYLEPPPRCRPPSGSTANPALTR